jgi:hypothetical protein
MQELEVIQPEESQEGGEVREEVEATEAAEEQALEDAAVEPGARVEETQDFEQAEALEGALTEAMSSTEEIEATPITLLEDPPDAIDEVDNDPVPLPGPNEGEVAIGIGELQEDEVVDHEAPEAVSAEEVRASLSEEQQAALSGLDPKDQEDLLRVIGQSQRILPDQLPGHSGGLIY